MGKVLKNNRFDNQKMTEAWACVTKATKITLLTHFRPDGDGVSACAALEHILTKENKKIETIYPCVPEFDFKYQPKNVLINQHNQQPDLIIMCDTANYQRAYFPECFNAIPVINIDHHISNSIHGTFNFVNIDYSSACEGLFLILQFVIPQGIDTYAASCLLSGILYDSLIFQTQATTPQTLNIAAQLMNLGADLYTLKTELVANKNPQIIAFWGRIMSSVTGSSSGKIVWAKVTQKDLQEYKLKLSSLVGFHNFLSQVSTVDVTILFYETESGQTKVSLRSKQTDVNKLAAEFGGGGHKNAAGILSSEPMDTVVKKVLLVLNKL